MYARSIVDAFVNYLPVQRWYKHKSEYDEKKCVFIVSPLKTYFHIRFENTPDSLKKYLPYRENHFLNFNCDESDSEYDATTCNDLVNWEIYQVNDNFIIFTRYFKHMKQFVNSIIKNVIVFNIFLFKSTC